MKQAGNTQAKIAQAIGFSQFTISKELSRICGKRGYRNKQALYELPDKSSNETSRGIVKLLLGLEGKTSNYDNGLEFAQHEFVNDLLVCDS